MIYGQIFIYCGSKSLNLLDCVVYRNTMLGRVSIPLWFQGDGGTTDGSTIGMNFTCFTFYW